MNFLHYCRNLLYSFLQKQTLGSRILLIKDNKILLVKHTYMPGWYTIGGAIDAGESPLEAAKRELKEEVGIVLKENPKLFSIYHNPVQKYDNYVVLYVGGDYRQQEVSSPEILDKRWFSLDALPEDITPATLRRINEYLGKVEIQDKW